MTIFDILWPAWLIAFAVIEGIAIRHDNRDFPTGDHSSFSAHLRRWFYVNTHFGRTLWLAFSLVFVIWFVPHIGGGF